MDFLLGLGVSEEPSVQSFSIYIPNLDRDRNPIAGWSDWVRGAIHLLTRINGGSTSLPPSQSGYRRSDGAFELNDTVVVYSLIRDPDAFEQRFDEIRAFMSDFGRRTNQESVMFEFSDGHSAYFLDESEYV